MKLLLHTCCAPCLIYPLERLKEKGFEVIGLFYNPNIHPFAEYKNRKQAVADFSHKHNLEVIYPEYNPAEYFQAVNPVRNTMQTNDNTIVSNGVNLKEDKPQRCSICWSLRLAKTAEAAKEIGCNYFSSTLLVSPYQDQEALKKIGSDIANAQGLDFYYEDFRSGFKKAHDTARAQNIYCQKYCGCLYSELERCRKSVKH